MSLMRLRALRAGFALARPMVASTWRAAVVAMRSSSAMTTVSLQTGPTGARMFSVFMPALYPAAATKKTTTRKATTTKKAATTKTKAATKKTKAGTRKKAAPKKKAATRGKAAAKPKPKSRKRKVLTPEERAQKRRDLYAKEKRAELKAIPKPPKRAPSGYGLFVQQQFLTQSVSGPATSVSTKIAIAWKALSDAERQRFKDQAEAIKPLHEAQYEKWAKTVGYKNIRKLNLARLSAGKPRLGIPDVVRPVSKTSAYVTFFQEKYAAGELGKEGSKSAAKLAGQLWRQLPLADKAAYEARSAAAWKQKLARQA